MNRKFTTWVALSTAALISIALFPAGVLKIIGVKEMISFFDHFGMPIWFMRFVGVAEVAGTIGLWLTAASFRGWPLRLLAALGLAILMGGAAGTHLIHDPFGSAIPAIILLLLSLFLAWNYRGDAKLAP